LDAAYHCRNVHLFWHLCPTAYERQKAGPGGPHSVANAELTQIFETSADGMRVIDSKFNMLRANETFCRLTGIPKEDAELLEKATKLPKLVDTNVHLVQKISSDLRPGLLDNLGLSAAMEWQTGQFQNQTGILCDIICEPNEIVLDQTRSTALFRIFQETLTNIIRHAEATRVEIALREKGDEIQLTVTDNGKGITEQETSDPKSFGLMGIKERIHSLGGDVEILGINGQGTTVSVSIPAGVSKDSTRAEDTGSR